MAPKAARRDPLHYCNYCGQSFTHASSMSRHKDVHSDIRRFVCGSCGKSYKHYSSLRTHQQASHTGSLFLCEVCGEDFCESITFKTHLQDHHAVRHYVCKDCGKTFTDSTNLKSHERNVHNFPTYTCPTCGKAFEMLTELYTHLEHTLDHSIDYPDILAGHDIVSIYRKPAKLSRTVHIGPQEKSVQILDNGGVDIVQIRQFPSNPRHIRIY